MICPGDLSIVVQRIAEDAAILGLGDLDLKRASSHPGQVGLVLEDRMGSILYVVELQLGPTDDRHVIRLAERWAAEQKRHRSRRCFAVLVAEEIAPRHLHILRLINRAVPVVVMEMRMSGAAGIAPLQFAPVGLRLR